MIKQSKPLSAPDDVDKQLAFDDFSEMLAARLDRHSAEVDDALARFSSVPLSEGEAAKQSELAGMVSGYRRMNFRNLRGLGAEEMRLAMARELTDMALSNVAFDVVWSSGDESIVYVCGREARVD